MFDSSISPPTFDPSLVNSAFSNSAVNDKTYPLPDYSNNSSHDRKINTAECLYSFNTQLSPNGLFLCLKTFQSSCLGYIGNLPSSYYLQVIKTRTPTPESHENINNNNTNSETTVNASEPTGVSTNAVENSNNTSAMSVDVNGNTLDNSQTSAPSPPKRLAIGVDGGFDGRGYTEDTKYLLAYKDPQTNKIYNSDLDLCENDHVKQITSAVIAATATDQVEIKAWEGDIREVDPLLEFYFQQPLEAGNMPNISKCSICDKTDNLWINLGTGFVGCGRKYYDGTGGNNHGIEHFQTVGESTARYSIKIGTISSNLEAIDVYDMKEDKFVKDPKIIEHLKHLGIDPYKQSKTEKTVTEMEIDLNKKFGNEWDVIQEKGKDLKPASTCFGIENLGSTCYLSAVIQALLVFPQVQERFCSRQDFHNYAKSLIEKDNYHPRSLLKNLEFQTRKLFSSLFNGPVCDLGEHVNIRPLNFKMLVGEDHPEFKAWSQQDSLEWFQYFVEVLGKKCKEGRNPGEFFNFNQEERLQCTQSLKWRILQSTDSVMQMPVNLDDKTPDTNTITLDKCLSRFFAPQEIEDFNSPATGSKGLALKSTKLKTLPDLLLLQIGKFYFDEAWQPKKYNVEVDVPNEIDISAFKLTETDTISESEFLPEAAPVEVEVDMEKVNTLVSMGYELYACKRAIHATNDVAAAFEWLLNHENDSDLHTPLMATPEASGVFSGRANSTSNQNSTSHGQANEPPIDLSLITGMGFTEAQAKHALKQTNNNIERAADWIFSHMDELANITEEPEMVTNTTEGATENNDNHTSNAAPVTDGSGRYRLRAFVSHMGSNANTGHYVAHVRNDPVKDDWVIFNDDKACHSVEVPKKLGYLYFFERI